MMKLFGKICWPAVLAGLLCATVLAPTAILSLHLAAAACCSDSSDCSNRPLSPHQSHHCPVCLTADAVMGKSLCPAPVVVCGDLARVLFFNVERDDAVGSLYPHIRIPRAPPTA